MRISLFLDAGSNAILRRIVGYLAPVVTVVCVWGCSSSPPIVLQWQYTGGPIAQNVTAMLVDESARGSAWAALDDGEIFRTTDHGTAWRRIAAIGGRPHVYLLVPVPGGQGKMYAATQAGIFSSPNNGRDWQSHPLGIRETIATRAIAVDPWNTDLLYAGTLGRGPARSTDGGRTWTTTSDTSFPELARADIFAIQIDIAHPDVLYAGSSLGILKTTDRGIRWTLLKDANISPSPAATHLLIDPHADQTMVCGTGGGDLYRSTNGGESWTAVRYGSEADRILSLLHDPLNPQTLYASTTTGILISSDFGKSWSPQKSNLPQLAVSLVSAPKSIGQELYAFGGGIGVQRSTDGGITWRSSDANLGGATATLIEAAPDGGGLFAAVSGTLLSYRESDMVWIPAGLGLLGDTVRSIAFDRDSASTMFAGTSVGLFRSTDGGASWQRTAQRLRMSPSLLDTHPWLRTRVFASGDLGIYVSTDRGYSWTQTRPVTTRYRLSTVTYAPNNAGLLLGTTRNSSVVASNDGGLSWSPARYGLGDIHIVWISRDDEDPQICYSWGSQGEGYRSTNNGLEWNRFASPWKAGDTVRFAGEGAFPSSLVVLVNNREVYYTPSGGRTWYRLLVSALPSPGSALHWDVGDEILYAGARERGVYRLPLGGLIRQKVDRGS